MNSEQHYTAQFNSCPIAFLRQGSIGTDVIELQHMLQLQGFNPGAIDGNFGVRTHTAVYRFQFEQNLTLTGSVDLETWLILRQIALYKLSIMCMTKFGRFRQILSK